MVNADFFTPNYEAHYQKLLTVLKEQARARRHQAASQGGLLIWRMLVGRVPSY